MKRRSVNIQRSQRRTIAPEEQLIRNASVPQPLSLEAMLLLTALTQPVVYGTDRMSPIMGGVNLTADRLLAQANWRPRGAAA